MLREIRFQNFRALKKAALPLSRVTLIVGPNGCGKSTVLQAIRLLSGHKDQRTKYDDLVSVDQRGGNRSVEVKFVWDVEGPESATVLKWDRGNQSSRGSSRGESEEIKLFTSRIRVFSLVPTAIAQPVQLVPNVQLEPNGTGLAGVLDNLRDTLPDRFNAFNTEMSKWLPEYDQIVFSVPTPGSKEFSLRRRQDGLDVLSRDLSDGTLFSLALLALAYLPSPPLLIGLEEPDHGIHPRLLRRVHDAIHRLAYPEDFGDKRPPTQVIATTHSPYFLDLFKEHPEEVVFADKDANGVKFQRLKDRPRMDEILPDGPLGELWYSGVLGGVPVEPAQP